MKNIQLFEGHIYNANCSFSNINDFMNVSKNLFLDNKIVDEKLFIFLEDFISRYENLERYNNITDDLAKYHFLAADYSQILNSISCSSSLFEMSEEYNAIKKEFFKLNLEFNDPKIEIVKRFPKPYHNKSWGAFAPDEGDNKKYGIDPGIYFLSDKLLPHYTPILLTHEIVHIIVGQKNPNLLGRGLEEGLANLVGPLIIGQKLYGHRPSSNFIKYLYMPNTNYTRTKQWYMNFLRQALFLFNNFGLEGILTLLKKGRQSIKDTELHLSNCDIGKINLPKGKINKHISTFLQEVILCNIHTMSVSPLAKYICTFIEEKDSIDDISAKSKVNKKFVKKAIAEIENNTFLLVANNNKISISDVSLAIKSNYLKYELG